MKRPTIDPLALTYDELKQRMLDEDRCCELGVLVPCVCLVSVECAIHGSICVGAHVSESIREAA